MAAHADDLERRKITSRTHDAHAPGGAARMAKGRRAAGADPLCAAVVFLELLAHGIPEPFHEFLEVVVVAAKRHFAAIARLAQPLAKLPRLEPCRVALGDGGYVEVIEVIQKDALKDIGV